MKRILIPTDFSPVADNALRYAIEIATQFKSEIFLYHAYYIHKTDYNLDYPDDEQPYKRQVERKMEFTKRKYQEELRQRGLSVQTLLEHDSIYPLFKRKAKNYGIDLIIMGSKGASGLEKAIFGTVAATALELSKVPVLIVPPGHSFTQLKHLILAMDEEVLSEADLAPVQKLAGKFEAKLTGLHVRKAISKSHPYKPDLYLKDVEITFREVPVSGSVNETINEFAKRNKCDLLCMVRREKVFLKSLFQKSITKSQVYNSNVPLLILPENQS